ITAASYPALAMRAISTRPMTSSMPGSDSFSTRPTSSLSRYVPRTAMVDSRSRRGASHRSKARVASRFAAARRGTWGTGRGAPVTRMPRTSPRDDAGSVEIRSVRRVRAASIANAAAQVVLPTPPLPPTKCQAGLVFVPLKGGFDTGDLHVARRDDGRLASALPLSDLANPRDDLRLQLVERVLGHLTEFDAHLRRKQLVAQLPFVVQFALDRRRDFIEHETDAADEETVNYQHWLKAQDLCLMVAHGERHMPPTTEVAALSGHEPTAASRHKP